ncbi:DNA-3-methyladenine glycosylase [Castellaniella sp.]|uniref:DNA-3-methyladenine glycosylase family protein n=1 Tax=Castellaniella sp. TaxID=1955812 RepID=UPI0025B87C6B|nr:DNA-3-methyladenine glycosylase [Castellaniella sp.]
MLTLDPHLVPVSRIAGKVAPRTRPAGFQGLARIICGQQLSVQSADAIWARLEDRGGAQSAQAFLDLGLAGVQGVGLSRTKYAYLRAVAQAVASGDLDLAHIVTLPADQAVAAMTRHKGIGPWTAEIYLMFCAGHPDVFPVGDLALRKAVADALALGTEVDVRTLADLAARWAPYRSTAALLFWRFYAAVRQRQGVPV